MVKRDLDSNLKTLTKHQELLGTEGGVDTLQDQLVLKPHQMAVRSHSEVALLAQSPEIKQEVTWEERKKLKDEAWQDKIDRTSASYKKIQELKFSRRELTKGRKQKEKERYLKREEKRKEREEEMKTKKEEEIE